MKTDTRLTEWERSGMTEPELITEPKTNGHWTMKPSQRKALQASDDDGAALPHNTPLTRANVEQIYGVGVDIDEMAAVPPPPMRLRQWQPTCASGRTRSYTWSHAARS